MESRLGPWLAGFFLLTFAFFLPWSGDWDQDARLDLSLSLAAHGTSAIDPYRWNTQDVSVYHGHTYSVTAPGQSLLGVPLTVAYRGLVGALQGRSTVDAIGHPTSGGWLSFYLLHYLLCVTTVGIPAVFLLLLMFWFLGILGTPTIYRLILTVALGLGTMIFPYAQVFYSHIPATLLLFAAFTVAYLLVHPDTATGRRGRWLATHPPHAATLIGLLAGFAEVFEYPSLVISGFIGLYVARHCPWRQWLFMVLGLLPGACTVFMYDTLTFGSPLATGYGAYSVQLKKRFGAAGTNGFAGLSWPPHLDAFHGMTFSNYRGLFFLSPFLLLAVPGCVLWARRGAREWQFVGGLTVTYFIIIAMLPFWEAGSTIGPRYLIPLLPFLTVPIAFVFQARRRLVRLAATALIAISVVNVVTETLGSVRGYPPGNYAGSLYSFNPQGLAHARIILNLGSVLIGPLVGTYAPATLLPLVILLLVWSIIVFRQQIFRVPRRTRRGALAHVGRPRIEHSHPGRWRDGAEPGTHPLT